MSEKRPIQEIEYKMDKHVNFLESRSVISLQKEINNIVTMFNNEIRKWLSKDAFRKSGVNFSIRLIKKFIDAQRIFGDDWRDFNTVYRRLEAACEMADLTEEVKNPIPKKISMPKMVEGKFINPRTGNPYSDTYQSDLRKKYGLGRKTA